MDMQTSAMLPIAVSKLNYFLTLFSTALRCAPAQVLALPRYLPYVPAEGHEEMTTYKGTMKERLGWALGQPGLPQRVYDIKPTDPCWDVMHEPLYS